jgi:hypothetical protein
MSDGTSTLVDCPFTFNLKGMAFAPEQRYYSIGLRHRTETTNFAKNKGNSRPPEASTQTPKALLDSCFPQHLIGRGF